MNVRFKKTNKGEVAILSRKDYEVIAAKAQQADENLGTTRIVARASGLLKRSAVSAVSATA